MLAPRAPWFYRVLQWVVQVLLRLFTRWEVTGLEQVPQEGALIVAPNHIYLLDVAIVFAAIPRRMIVFAGEKWRGTPGGWLMDAVAQAIYVTRGEVDRRALGQALAVLRAEGALGVAPEGTRSPDGKLQVGKDGVAYLAARSGAPVLPVATWGQEQIFRSLRHLRRPVVHIHIGEPIRLPSEASHARAGELSTYTNLIMLALARLLPPAYRGVYTDQVSEP